MSNGKTTAAGLGIMSGLALGFRDYRREIDRDVHYNRETSQDALELATDGQRRLDQMLKNGDFLRLADSHIADLMVGLSFPDQSATSPPSAFASIPSVLTLPNLSEALAVAPDGWPGATNQYNPDGTIANQSAAFVGQNVATGIALGNAAVRSFLMGLTESSMPTANKLAMLHRLQRSLVTVLGEYESVPLTAAGLRTMWRNLLSPASPGSPFFSGRIWSQISRVGLIHTFTAETVIYVVPIPPGCMGIGESVIAEMSGFSNGLGAGNTVTYRAHLDSLSGPTLFSVGGVVIGAQETFHLAVQLDRGADSGGSASFVVDPVFRLLATTGTGSSVLPTDIAFDHSVLHSIVFSVQCNVSSVSNNIQGQKAILHKI